MTEDAAKDMIKDAWQEMQDRLAEEGVTNLEISTITTGGYLSVETVVLDFDYLIDNTLDLPKIGYCYDTPIHRLLNTD